MQEHEKESPRREYEEIEFMGLPIKVNDLSNRYLRRAIRKSHSQSAYRFGHDEKYDDYCDYTEAHTDPGTSYE
ncbi:hypothetical protein GF342_03360 [Candidatus Woesearchaeota archaeon]|nr:hypothetical protein [Candidatus Woesearchaeota archaeon]